MEQQIIFIDEETIEPEDLESDLEECKFLHIVGYL